VKSKKILKIIAVIIAAFFVGFLFRYYHLQSDSLYGVRVIGDGSGGAYALYEDHIGGNIYAQKISPEGKLLWGEKGILLGRNENHCYLHSMLEIGSISTGGVIVTWPDFITEPEFTFLRYVVILDSNGDIIWQKAVESYGPASNGPGDITQFRTKIVRAPNSIFGDICLNRTNSYRNNAWQGGDVLLGLNKVGGKPIGEPFVASDGTGGAIISWRDLRNSGSGQANIYAQRIDAEGNKLWKTEGVNVTLTSLNPRNSMVSDGLGGVIISYSFRDDDNSQERRLQRVDPDGRTLWPENGLILNHSVMDSQDMAADGQGGVIIGWGVRVSFLKAEKAFIQRIDSIGSVLWGEEGILLNR
jgi:hypothetical protein